MWPTKTSSVPPPPSSSTAFDPFESFQQTTIPSNDLFQPMVPSTVSTMTNKTSSNDLDFFTMPTQSTQQSSMFFPTQQQQQQQSFVRPPMFQQSQSMIFSSTQQQQFNKPNNNSFNVS
jgi:hypothetical protein